MNMAVGNKTAALQFLDEHDRIVSELQTANLTIDDQRREIQKQDALIAVLRDQLAQANTDKNTFLQYSFELSAQLQFIVSGSARALLIAGQVRNAIAMRSVEVPPVQNTELAELEDIIRRVGEHNASAGDGYGLTNATSTDARAVTAQEDSGTVATDEPPVTAGNACPCGHSDEPCPDANGVPLCNKPAPIGDNAAPGPMPSIPPMTGAGPQDLPSGIDPPPLVGVMVDRNGRPLEMSAATRMMMTGNNLQ